MRTILKELQRTKEFIFVVYRSAPNDPMLCTIESVPSPVWYDPRTWFSDIVVTEKYSVNDGEPLSTSIVRIDEIIEVETEWAVGDEAMSLADKLETYTARAALNQLWTKDIDVSPEEDE